MIVNKLNINKIVWYIYRKNTMQQNTGKNRNIIDKFYTKPGIVQKYINTALSYIDNTELIIEPSAGNGVWLKTLKRYNFIGYDIEPEDETVIKQNFLELDLNIYNENIHFIGNPPFGRQSSMARKFIKHICSYKQSKTIAFILPKSFKKHSYQKAFPLRYHLVYQEDVEKNAFLINDTPYDVPCVFQIWKQKDINREIPKKQVPKGFTFVKKEENPHYSLRRVGVYAGKISNEIENKSKQSHYFIKLDNDHEDFVNKYNTIKWNHDNTVGPKSISKQEYIIELNKLF